MRAVKRNSKLYKHLEEAGVLSEGEAVIKAAIKVYYRNYDKNLKQKKRKTEKRCISISIPIKDLAKIRSQANAYGAKDIPEYTKILLQSDIQNNNPIHSSKIYLQILQKLQFFKNEIEYWKGKNYSNWMQNADFDQLATTIYKMEQEIKGLIK